MPPPMLSKVDNKDGEDMRYPLKDALDRYLAERGPENRLGKSSWHRRRCGRPHRCPLSSGVLRGEGDALCLQDIGTEQAQRFRNDYLPAIISPRALGTVGEDHSQAHHPAGRAVGAGAARSASRCGPVEGTEECPEGQASPRGWPVAVHPRAGHEAAHRVPAGGPDGRRHAAGAGDGLSIRRTGGPHRGCR